MQQGREHKGKNMLSINNEKKVLLCIAPGMHEGMERRHTSSSARARGGARAQTKPRGVQSRGQKGRERTGRQWIYTIKRSAHPQDSRSGSRKAVLRLPPAMPSGRSSGPFLGQAGEVSTWLLEVARSGLRARARAAPLPRPPASPRCPASAYQHSRGDQSSARS